MPPHVFVGGTGRSGTTAMARLIGQYPRHHSIDIEVKVHAAPGGLIDVVQGRAEAASFVERVKTEWYDRGWDGGGRGLHWLHRGRWIHRMCERFLEQVERDPQEAGRLFMHDLLDPLLPIDRDAWVEMTPLNATVMPQLSGWFPLAQFVLAVRDGRDVVSSVLRQPWGPASWDEGLSWWAQGMRQAEAGRRVVGDERVLVIQLEDLTHHERGEDAQGRLVTFLGVDDSEGVRNYRRHRVNRDRANVGRWAKDLDDQQRRNVEAEYERLLAELHSEGVRDLPTKA